jgi:hypothetical protein
MDIHQDTSFRSILDNDSISLQKIMIYLIEKLNKKLIILTFGQFDHLVILNKSIWTRPTWLMVFWLVKQVKQKLGQPKKIF